MLNVRSYMKATKAPVIHSDKGEKVKLTLHLITRHSVKAYVGLGV
jgi:hypothetical protein